jgi:hypothetical protein
MTVLVRACCRGFHSSRAEQNLGFRASRTRNTVTVTCYFHDPALRQLTVTSSQSMSLAQCHFPDVLRA